MVQVQEWIDKNYLKEERKDAKELSVRFKQLEGHCDLTDFVNLEKLICLDNQLRSLDLSNSIKLTEIDCRRNQLTDLKLPHNLPNLTTFNCSNNLLTNLNFIESFNPQCLTRLGLASNNFPIQNLSIFTHLVSLELLYIGNDDQSRINQNIYNRFNKSLVHLQNCTELKSLHIANTDIDSGLEYLPFKLERIYCQTDYLPTAKLKRMQEILEPYKKKEQVEYYDYLGWKKDNRNLINQILENSRILNIINTINSALARGTHVSNELTKEEKVFQAVTFYLEGEIKDMQKELYKKNEFETQIQVTTR